MEHLATCHLRLLQHTSDGKYSAMLCAALSRAFDRVNHRKLLQRLGRDFGVRGRLWNVIQAFLGNRSAVVKVDGVTSRPREMEMGVPQGRSWHPSSLHSSWTIWLGVSKLRVWNACCTRMTWLSWCQRLTLGTCGREWRGDWRSSKTGQRAFNSSSAGRRRRHLFETRMATLLRSRWSTQNRIHGAATPLRCVSRLRYLGMHAGRLGDPGNLRPTTSRGKETHGRTRGTRLALPLRRSATVHPVSGAGAPVRSRDGARVRPQKKQRKGKSKTVQT